MALRPRPYTLLSLVLLVVASACGTANNGDKKSAAGLDHDDDHVADDLGGLVDGNDDGFGDQIDIDHDGKPDGTGVDTDGDGRVDALGIDTDCDGVFDGYDVNGDGKADFVTALQPMQAQDADCKVTLSGSRNGGGAGGSRSGTAGSGGANNGGGGVSMGGATGGVVGQSGSTTGGAGKGGSAGSGTAGGVSALGKGVYQGTGSSTDQFAESDIYRNGVGYKFIANGWGSAWHSHDISWNGTSFAVKSLQGNQGENYSPAGYPTVFCGLYSMKQSVGGCGLPAAVNSLKQVKTGWRWAANGNGGQYNAAWDIWLGNGNSLSSYLMVWLRDPPGQQPAGAAAIAGVSVKGLPGTWNIWTGNVMGRPIVNYVKAEGQDLAELEYDVLDVYHDAMDRKFNLPGSNIIAVAVGFEVWNGPIANLKTDDFYVDVK